MGFYISRVYSSLFVCADSIKHYISWNQSGNYTILDGNQETLLNNPDSNLESESDIIQITKMENKYTILTNTSNDDYKIDQMNRDDTNNNKQIIENIEEEDDMNLNIDISNENKDKDNLKQILFNKNDNDL